MADFLVDSLSTIVLLVLGGYIMFAGRKYIWLTTGAVGLTVTARILAILVSGFDSGRELIEYQEWGLVGLALAVGLLGVVIGRLKPQLAAMLIGFAAGADLALWFYGIVSYLITDVANLPENLVLWVALAVIVIGGLFGLWLIRQSGNEALILITVLIGVQFVQDLLGFDKSSSWTAIIILSLGLAGLLVQYAYYLRELKALEQTEPALDPTSVAYFQNLQLDE